MAIKQWLSDKKNIPIIAAAAVALLVVAGLIVAFATGLLGSKTASEPAFVPPGQSSAPPMQRPGPGAPNVAGVPGRPGLPPSQVGRPGQSPFTAPPALRPPGMPGAPAMAAKPTQMPSAATIASSNLSPAQKAVLMRNMPQMAALQNMTQQQKLALGKKMISQMSASGIKMPNIPGIAVMTATAHNPNPFTPPVNVKQLTALAVPPPVSTYVPFVSISRLPNLNSGTKEYPVPSQASTGVPPISVPLGRVAGIINSNGIRAIYEIDGHDTIITPGSLLPENGGRVQSIQSDGITVRLPDSRQTVQVPITAGNPATQTQNGGGPSTDTPPPTDQGNPGDGTSD